MIPERVARLLPLGCAVAAVQMIVFVTAAGWLRPGYDSSRNWVSQLSLGPHGWLNNINLALCGLWLLAGAAGLRRTSNTATLVSQRRTSNTAADASQRRTSNTAADASQRRTSNTAALVTQRRTSNAAMPKNQRRASNLVAWCGVSLVALAVLPTDAGIGYPPGTEATHTTIGLVHQLVAITLGLAGIGAAALLGRRAVAYAIAGIMTVTFVAASVLVLLDAADVLPGNPSGLLERVALFLGLGWIGWVTAREVSSPAKKEAETVTREWVGGGR
ncbi:DUF998 domain-containing protein [Paractinoplanes lichenicola]|uniref:DUF998 domain-containing protein n=1 Tax=Paractinoplanes lichenicola TaxID=2802976 RepID=A0ABS1VZX9_9ACTN|nr:DUF998 domain-containing protein [Actinoplanes lichenicola]MBL7260041.1 DUF998 domain-containing protein [Actinoplanes lichenicola]